MERVTRAEAARMLNVNRSTVTRWIDRHPGLLDAAGLVDPVELQRHRDAMINPKLQTRGQAASVHLPEASSADSIWQSFQYVSDALREPFARKGLKDEVAQEIIDAIRSSFEIMHLETAELAGSYSEALAQMDNPQEIFRTIRAMNQRLLSRGVEGVIYSMEFEDTDREEA